MELLKPAQYGLAGSDIFHSDQPRLKVRFGVPRSRITIEIESEQDICKGDGSPEDAQRAKTHLAAALRNILSEIEAE